MADLVFYVYLFGSQNWFISWFILLKLRESSPVFNLYEIHFFVLILKISTLFCLSLQGFVI